MRRFAIISVVAGVLTVAATALAGEWSKEGKIGEFVVHATWSYDEFKLVGSPNVCASPVESSWRNRIRFYHSDSGYEAVSKTLLAAKLSGASVEVTGENNAENKCVLKHLRILE
jgi:hypothetical protein